MRFRTGVTIAAGTALLASATACAGTPPPASSGLTESTRANVVAAMHGEAFAHAKYLAYADQAQRDGHDRAVQQFRSAAGTELSDHFAGEADLIGLGSGDLSATLREAIAGESGESTTMYPEFAARAASTGDTAAAQLFSGIAADEAAHARDFTTALTALTAPAAGVAVPPGPPAAATAIVAGPARSSGATLADLRTAMQREAFAFAKYTRYAEARRAGNPAIADLFSRTAHIELTEHFAEEATLAGLVSPDTRTNLADAAAGEKQEAESMYPGYARQADQAGNPQAGKLFREIAADEKTHEQAFRTALTAT